MTEPTTSLTGPLNRSGDNRAAETHPTGKPKGLTPQRFRKLDDRTLREFGGMMSVTLGHNIIASSARVGRHGLRCVPRRWSRGVIEDRFEKGLAFLAHAAKSIVVLDRAKRSGPQPTGKHVRTFHGDRCRRWPNLGRGGGQRDEEFGEAFQPIPLSANDSFANRRARKG